MNEDAITFSCQGSELLGIVHCTKTPSETGVLIVVGGPQYRVGSHRQFVLLARYLASQGIPVFRFDYRNMGDSEGELITFDQTQNDICAAIDKFMEKIPSVKNIVIWGLCDAVCAALFYAYQDNRVKGLVLLNPWVRTIAGEAKAYLKHYYLRRIVSAEFWRKVLTLKFNVAESVGSLLQIINRVLRSNLIQKKNNHNKPNKQKIDLTLSLPDRMLQGLQFYKGRVLLILSGNHDYTADEFRDVVNSSTGWKQCLASSRITRKDFYEADHTFSTEAWRSKVEHWTCDWIKQSF